ncbi:MAG: diguanylate cyclase [Geobacteraceae bacterium]|nr:diguanylate cyclase [Geobacteraceae bacterium]
MCLDNAKSCLKESMEKNISIVAQDFCAIMFDVDFFKKVNDTHVHQCGAFLLKGVSGSVTSLIRYPSPSSLLESADEALYQVKGPERNRVVALS